MSTRVSAFVSSTASAHFHSSFTKSTAVCKVSTRGITSVSNTTTRRTNPFRYTKPAPTMLANIFGTRQVRDSQWDKISSAPGEAATFGAGCYWGTEKFFAKDFEKKFPGSIIASAVGFMGPKGAKENPTYYEVCMGATGHVEVLQIKYDPAKCSYEDLCKFFFTFHDPTTKNRQGNDRGTQYASVIFAHNDEQVKVAQKVKQELQELVDKKVLTCFTEPNVSTAIVPATKFYPAHEEHQLYLEKNPTGYCNHGIRFEWKD